MIELAAALEASAFATALRQSTWVYPLVNAGHILGLALLIGAVVPMDVAVLRRGVVGALAGLRAYAVAGFGLAVICGAMLFSVQATDYIQSPWFLGKLALVSLASINALLHLCGVSKTTPRRFAGASLLLWIGALIAGRMIAYS